MRDRTNTDRTNPERPEPSRAGTRRSDGSSPASPAPTRRAALALVGGALAMPLAIPLAAPFVSRGARAGSPVGVVELFTSQGCSSCPPADAVLGELIEADEALGLAYHVTYWDYLGWTDALATEAGTRRQYAYARALGRPGVYTPQAVVNGRSHHVGSRAGEVRTALREGAPSLPVRLERVGDRLRVALADADAPNGDGRADSDAFDVTLVRFRERVTAEVERGENRGRRLVYHHPVAAIEALGQWSEGAFERSVEASEGGASEGGAAVLVQRRGPSGPGPIIGAAALAGSREG